MPDLQSLGSSAAIVCAIIAIVRRKQAIGGWLFYFICQVFIGLALLVVSTHWKYYLPFQWHDPLRYFLFTLFSLSRMVVFGAASVICILLIESRDARWIVALQLTLLLYAFTTVLKVPVDLYCFPGATNRDAVSLGFPLIWAIYFSVSERVKKVFRERVWK
jgi:hypothetical protein